MIRKRLNKYGLFGKVAGESLFSLQNVLNNVLWTGETKVVMSGHSALQHLWRYQHKPLIPTVNQLVGG